MRSPIDTLALGILSLCVNVVLMLVKIGVGLVGNSYALVADGIESASDIFSSLITWAGFRISLRPADEDHPFGHGKLEALAGGFAGITLLAAAGVIAVNSVSEILTPQHAPEWFTLPVLIGVVVVKEILSRLIFSAGEELGSTALQGDAWHHRSDAISSGAAAIGIAVALIGGPGFEAADDWAALVACGIIVVNGLRILRIALHDVMDGSVPTEWHQAVRDSALAIPGVVDTEKCRIRKSGTNQFVELHVCVNPTISVFDGHEIGHRVKERILADNPRVRDVLVHIEPAP
jgi:cation diffusion facilitator family transporter